MVNFALVDEVTGVIHQIGRTDIESVMAVSFSSEWALIAPFDISLDPERYYWNWQQEAFVELPPQPAWWAEWNGQEWIDPRTPADFAAALSAARQSAQRDKSGLLMDLAMMGVLTVPEAVQAARGDIPETFEAALSSLPEESQGMARIKWAGDQVISRMNPLILMAAYAKGITDEQLDQAFGVQAPV